MSTNTQYYNLQIDTGPDVFNPLTSIFPNFQKIDTAMHANKIGGVVVGTHLLSGSVHAITVSDAEGFSMFRFVATAAYSEGQTFTVNGTPVTASTSAGTSLPDGCFVVNQNVLGCLVGTQLTLFVSGAGGTASDAEKLGGQLPSYYATATGLSAVQAVANNALQTANSANTTAAGASSIAQQAQASASTARPVKLWENSNPTASFSAQTIQVGANNYDMIAIMFNRTASSGYATEPLLLYNNGSQTLFQSSYNMGSYQSIRQGTVNWTDGSIQFSNGQIANSQSSNSNQIPIVVVGFKF